MFARRLLLVVAAASLAFVAPSFAAKPKPAAKKALVKIVFATDWKAQAEHGGYYQALSTGLYRKAGLDVTIRQGGPAVNPPQLIAAVILIPRRLTALRLTRLIAVLVVLESDGSCRVTRHTLQAICRVIGVGAIERRTIDVNAAFTQAIAHRVILIIGRIGHKQATLWDHLLGLTRT